MSINLDQIGLRSVVKEYDHFFIDVWGVVHDGINLHKGAIEVLNNLNELKKEYVLLTNAPRPNLVVLNFLEQMGLSKDHSKKVYTSGEASLKFLKKEYDISKFFHIGPIKDFDLFFSFNNNKVLNINNAEFILCTGLFEKFDNDLEYYKKLLEKHTDKKMVCTNPDLIVNRGNKKEFCAGTVAKIFEEIGGSVEYFGKPYSLVYKISSSLNNKKILCIGDNLNTDIKGANNQNFDSLFITSGIHNSEINNDLRSLLKKYDVNTKYTQKYLKW